MTRVKQAPIRDRPQSSALTIRAVTNVIGGRLARATLEEARHLFNFLPGLTVKPLIEESITNLYNALPNTDLLHFTCHGSVTRQMLEISNEDADYMNLNLDIVQNLPVKPGCFIFVNACYSNSAVSVFKILTSFGWEFYKDGADIYIGTLAQIPEDYVGDFAGSFYQTLFSGRDLTVGQVMWEVKRKLSANQNIFWLLYSMYGDPLIKLKTTGTP